jgi:hypothetical protein
MIMKKYLVLATVFLLSSYAHAATMTWTGSAGLRYSNSNQTDDNSTVAISGSTSAQTNKRTEKAHMFRGAIGATGGWDNVEWGVGLRTIGNSLANTPSGSSASTVGTTVINSDWTTGSGTAGSNDLAIALENAWFKYGNDWGFGDVGLVFGRQPAAFVNGRNQVLIDSDVRFNGAAQTWQWGSFGLNLSQYVLGARSGGTDGATVYAENDFTKKNATTPGNFAVLYSFQPTFKWKFSDEIAAMFAVGYHQWSGTTGINYQNFIPNGERTGFGTAATSASLANGTAVWASRVSQENSRMWQFVMNWQLPFMLGVDFELVKNKAQRYAPPKAAGVPDNLPAKIVEQDDTAWAAGITYGQLKKAQDFMVAYTYHDKGLGAVHNRFTNDYVQAGFAGHEFNAAYNIANNFDVNAKYMSLDEKNGRNQIGVDAAKKLKTSLWAVGAGVKF